MTAKKIILSNVEGIARKSGTDPRSCTWIQYDIDPFTRDCECDGPECNPETCPRFIDTCCNCGAVFFGAGWLCLDSGETACCCCVEFRTDSDGNRY